MLNKNLNLSTKILVAIFLAAVATTATFFGPNWAMFFNPSIKNMHSISFLGLPQTISLILLLFGAFAFWYVLIRFITDLRVIARVSRIVKTTTFILLLAICVFLVAAKNFVPFLVDCGWPPKRNFFSYNNVMTFFFKTKCKQGFDPLTIYNLESDKNYDFFV